MRINKIELNQEIKSISLPGLSDLNCLFNGKKLTVAEASVHLMSGAKIYKELDYPTTESEAKKSDFECP